VGGYFGWGIGQIGDAKLPGADMTLDSACGGELACSQAVVRFGAQWQIHFGKGAASTDPWVGLGVGYEVFSTSFEGPAGDTSLIVHGFELGNLSFGYDVRAGDWLWVGPELRASFGQYSFIDVDCGTAACTASEAISNTALHGWFSAGLRGTFGR
jgi:hypothetical protein